LFEKERGGVREKGHGPQGLRIRVTEASAMRFFRTLMLVITLLTAVGAAPAGAQGSGLPGKSTVQGTAYFVSGGGDYTFTLNYRLTDTYSLTTGFESSTAGATSGTAFAVGFRYYLPVAADAKSEPYLFGGYVTATITAPGFAASSGSGVQLGVGGSSRVSNVVTLGGSLVWTSIAGGSSVGYSAGLQIDVTETTYTALGMSGGGGSSSFYVGVGRRF
jgi:hypothetical protein